MSPRQRIPKLAALLVYSVAVTVVAVTMYTKLAGGRIPAVSSDPYRVSVLVDEPLQLVKGSDVRRAGIRIGRVAEIRSRGQRALVTMELDEDHRVLFRDARVASRLRTLLGETYLSVDPGTKKAGRVEDGGVLPAEAARETVPLDKILNTLDMETRADLRGTLRTFGKSVDGRGRDLNAILSGLSEAVRVGSPVAELLEQEKQSLAGVIDDGGQVIEAVGRRGDQLRTLVRAMDTTSRAVAARDHELRQTIEALPGTLQQVRETLAKVETLAGTATPVSDDLTRAAAALKPVFDDLGPATADGRRLVNALPAALRVTDPMLKALRPAAEEAAPVVDALGPVLRNLIPVVEYLEPYKRDLWGVGAGMGSVFEFLGQNERAGYDATGGAHDRVAYGRVQLMANPASLGATPPSVKKLEDAILQTGVLRMLGGLKTNYYPAPGSAASPNRSDGSYKRVEAIPAGDGR